MVTYLFKKITMQRILYIIVILIVAGACKLQEQDNPLIIGTCMDGIKNQDEQDVDCGGVCPACAVVLEPGEEAWSLCHESLTPNRISIDGVTSAIWPEIHGIQRDNPSPNQQNYEFSIPLTNEIGDVTGTLRIWLSPDIEPTTSRVYNLVKGDKALRPGSARIMYDRNSYAEETFNTHDSGRLYMTVKGNTIFFELCNVLLYDIYEGTNTRKISGQVVYRKEVSMSGCSPAVYTNQVIMNDYWLEEFKLSDVTYTAPKAGANYHEYRIELPYDDESIVIRLSSDIKPTADRVYTIGESTGANSPKPGEAYMAYQFGSYYYYTGKSGDKLYMTVVDEYTVLFKFCNVDFYDYSNYAFQISGIVQYEP